MGNGANTERPPSGCRTPALNWQRIYSSPLQRALRTCELAGFAGRAEIDNDLVEWDYRDYEGLTTAEIRAVNPGWRTFRAGFPGGETLEQIGARADRVVNRVRSIDGPVLLFSSAHFLRVLAARWVGLYPADARHFVLDTASLSCLTYEHDRSEPAIGLWNDTRHWRDPHPED